LGEGNAVKVLHIVELLYDFKVGLKCVVLGG